MAQSMEEILLAIKTTASEIAGLEARLARQVLSFTHASPVKRGVDEELAMALCLTKFKAQDLIGNSAGLIERFPQVFGLVEQGRVPMASAVAVNKAAAWLGDDKVPEVDGVMAGRLVGKNPTSARRSANLAVARADPEGFEERARQALESRGFTLKHGPAGTAALFLENASVEKVVAAYLCVDQQARRLRAADDSRTLDQCRADVAVDMLLGKQFGGEVKAHVYVYVDALTLAGLRDDPAEVAGHGPVPASLARRIASGAGSVFQRIITDPVSGQVIELGRRRYRPKAGLAEFVRVRDRECRMPGCTRPAQFGDLDHCDANGRGWVDGCPTDAATLVGLCRAHHRVRDLPGWQHSVEGDGTLRITTPAKQEYSSRPEGLGGSAEA